MFFDFNFDLCDIGDLLQKMGFVKVIDGVKGKFEGCVVWCGLFMLIDYFMFNGCMVLNLECGQFLLVDLGLVKLVGVLSLQGLLYFVIDLCSVIGCGMLFESVVVIGIIVSGVVYIEDFVVKGLQFQVVM